MLLEPTKVSILCPSRGRPHLLRQMIDSARRNAVGPLEFLAYIDSDDPKRDQYMKWHAEHYFSTEEETDDFDLIIGTPCRVGVAWNDLAGRSTGGLLMMANDDLVFQTLNWDGKIKDAANNYHDGIFVAWCDDGAPNPEKRCTFPIVSRKWYETLGYFTPICFNFLWNDTWVGDIGKRVGRMVHVPDVLIEHCHFAFKKAEYDDTYQRHRIGSENLQKRADDKRMFQDTARDRERDAEKLRAVIG